MLIIFAPFSARLLVTLGGLIKNTAFMLMPSFARFYKNEAKVREKLKKQETLKWKMVTFFIWIYLEITSGNCWARACQIARTELQINWRDILCQFPLVYPFQ